MTNTGTRLPAGVADAPPSGLQPPPVLDSPLFNECTVCLRRAGFTADYAARTAELLVVFTGLLSDWNRRFNLVSRSAAFEELVCDALADAAVLTRVLPDEGDIVDAGAGAGLVAFPLSLLLPGRRFVLFEPRRHRAHFLQRLAGLGWGAELRGCADTALPESTVECLEGEPSPFRRGSGGDEGEETTDGEPFALKPADYRLDWIIRAERVEEGSIDPHAVEAAGLNRPVVYTRATWRPAAAWEACRRLLAPGGELVCLCGPDEPPPDSDWRLTTYEELLPEAGRRNKHRLLRRRLNPYVARV